MVAATIVRGIFESAATSTIACTHFTQKYKDDYNPNIKSTYLMYLDANNLYGYSMMKHLPLNGFMWCDDEFTAETILQIPDDAPVAYFFVKLIKSYMTNIKTTQCVQRNDVYQV